eukprot:TRINITY_DN3581_c2_g1_i1.p1 TRINITY_DN3581_c2_g1~~TRINITY_DN3581_c2_g1_i1.p1  ORF type:complete len:395 (-),score=58.17 TRINITY_DN3581_c2_g1_i1:1213-2337(-)
MSIAPAPEINELGKYTWLDVLGQGGFGLVGKAQNNRTGELVAIKVLDRRSLQSEPNEEKLNESKRRVEREILHHKKLTGHPLIVEFKEVFLTKSFLCIVMEYAQGGDMFKYIIDCYRSGAPLTEDDARGWFQQVVLALRFSHKHHIVNRDIKLENTLRAFELNGPRARWWGEKDKCGRDKHIWCAKLCDFGYSKHTVNNSAPRSRVGSLPYASPEVLYAAPGETYDGEKRDVWALGVMLYCLLVTSYPFDPRKYSHPVLFQVIRDADYKFPEACKVSKEAKQLVGCLLVPKPNQRFSIDQIIKDSWFKKNLPANWDKDFSQVSTQKQNLLQTDEEIKAIVEQVFIPVRNDFDVLVDDFDTYMSDEMLDPDMEIQ